MPMKLRVAINQKPIEGPYGGGNQFAHALERQLTDNGHFVTRSLKPNLDVILIVNAQRKSLAASFDVDKAALYKLRNPKTTVILRFNTCDEQRGRDLGINNEVLHAAEIADAYVFVSAFIRDHYLARGLNGSKPNRVIQTGADRSIFRNDRRADYAPGEPIRIVTHHWSDNYLKGFDFYQRLDDLLAQPAFGNRFQFTFIGRLNNAVELRNTTLLSPMSGEKLAAELSSHHLYLTGTRLEPGGNHYVEAMSCGLPVLYFRSGSTPEYCDGYGASFGFSDFEDVLQNAAANILALREQVLAYDYSSKEMTAAYLDFFLDQAQRKKEDASVPASAAVVLRKTAAYHASRIISLLKAAVGKIKRF